MRMFARCCTLDFRASVFNFLVCSRWRHLKLSNILYALCAVLLGYARYWSRKICHSAQVLSSIENFEFLSFRSSIQSDNQIYLVILNKSYFADRARHKETGALVALKKVQVHTPLYTGVGRILKSRSSIALLCLGHPFTLDAKGSV